MEIKVPKRVKILTSSHVSGSINSSDPIVIPEGIEEIDKEVFSGSSIKKIILPQSLKKIGDYAFSKCRELKEILLPDELEEIGNYAFYECNNLEYVRLPRTLKKIGKQAFNTKYVYSWYERTPTGKIKTRNGLSVIHSIEYESKIKRILLPPSLKEIGEDAFGYQNYLSYNKNKISYFVPKNSVAEKFALKQGYTVIQADIINGALMGPSMIGSTFCYADKDQKNVTIPETVKKIDEYAFYGCVNMNDVTFSSSLTEIGVNAFRGCVNLRKVVFKANGHLETIGEYAFGECENIEEIIIPKSVTEICDNAFRECKKLNKIVFQNDSCLKKIGSKAFCNYPLTLIDLPSSVETLSNDAFPKGCIVSIGGEMPFYSAALAEFVEKNLIVENKKNELTVLDNKLEKVNEKIKAHSNSYPTQTNDIPQLSNNRLMVLKEIEDRIGLLHAEIGAKCGEIAIIEGQLSVLQYERKKCFFLAFSKKQELDEKIIQKQNELQVHRNNLANLRAQVEKSEMDHTSNKSIFDRKIESLVKIRNDWNICDAQLRAECVKIEKERISLSEDIKELQSKIEKEKKALERKHKKWVDERNAELQRIEIERIEAEESKKRAALSAEKKKLLSALAVPACSKISLYQFKPRENIVEEELINLSFIRMINHKNSKKEIEAFNAFVSSNAEKIERIKAINQELGLDIEDGIEDLSRRDIPDICKSYLPERFVKLSSQFANLDTWNNFKHSISKLVQIEKKNKNTKTHDHFFVGSEYLTLSSEGVKLLIFPYCMVMYQVGKPLSVLTYNDLKIDVDYVDKEEIKESISGFGELIKEQYMHLNKDGSVSRRYSYNPLVKTIRYTTITIASNKDAFKSPVKSYQNALNVKSVFESYCRDITTDLMEKVYGLILQSAELADIEAAMDDLKKEKLLRLELLAQKEAEEKQRLEEERKAAILAAEAKRQEIIQRQRELNEERRRQAEEKKKMLQIFDDDFDVEKNDDVSESFEKGEVYFSVLENKAISNNVFKIALKQECSLDKKDFIAFFTDENGEIISNKKKIVTGNLGDETTLGFVLDSGIDYTKMKKCFMKITTEYDEIQTFEFKMNIAFYSDF